MKRYVEHRIQVKRMGPVNMIEVEDLEHLRGFRSVYEFSEDVARDIEARNSTAGLAGTLVYSDMLFLDFDDAPKAADQFEEKLRVGNIAYEKYDSGNRSVHFHVCIEPMEGPDVPKYQKMWVEKNAPGADTSFYHTAGIYRLPLTFHHKRPGRFKLKIRSRGGIYLEIPTNVELPKLDLKHEGSPEQLAEFYKFLTIEEYEGNRTPFMFKLIGSGLRAGLTYEQVEEAVLTWNQEKASPPHPEEKLRLWIKRAWNGQMESQWNLSGGV